MVRVKQREVEIIVYSVTLELSEPHINTATKSCIIQVLNPKEHANLPQTLMLQYSQGVSGSVVKHQGLWRPSGFLQ